MMPHARSISVGGHVYRYVVQGRSRYAGQTPRSLRVVIAFPEGKFVTLRFASLKWREDSERYASHSVEFAAPSAMKAAIGRLLEGPLPDGFEVPGWRLEAQGVSGTKKPLPRALRRGHKEKA